MSIVSDAEILDFLEISRQYFTVNASANVLKMSYDGGAVADVTLDDGTYEGEDLATELKTEMDSTLGCTATVSFSSTTYKFTIGVAAGHTIAYTHTGSDAASLFGLTQNHSAAVSFTSDEATGDPSAMALILRDALEDSIERYCKRTFESTSYTLEKYDGTGTRNLYLKNYPVTALTHLAMGTTDAIKIYNTTTNSSISVSVTSTGIVLSRDGSTDATLLFADNATMSAMVTAINAVGSGWSAATLSSLYDSFKSSYLLKRYGASAMDSNWVYLAMPYEEAEDEFEVYENQGRVCLPYSFPKGNRNIYVTYTAGYSSDDMPEDLKMAVKVGVKYFYSKWQGGTWNLIAYRTGDIEEKFANNSNSSSKSISLDLPNEIIPILFRYRRMSV